MPPLSRKLILPLAVSGLVCQPGWPCAPATAFAQGAVLAAVGDGRVIRHDRGLRPVDTLRSGVGGLITGMAFDAVGNLYVTNFDNGGVTRFSRAGVVHSPNPLAAGEPTNESIVFDADGHFYVGVADGTHDVLKYDLNGNLVGRFDVAVDQRGADWIDLAEDQHTLLYTSEGRRILRYDLRARQQLQDFAVLPGPGVAYALRILPDSGLLVADRFDIKRVQPSGAIVARYDLPGHDSWFALNLDPDGRSFWSGDDRIGRLARFDIESGAVLDTVTTGGSLTGIVVPGELTAARPSRLFVVSSSENWTEVLMDVTTLIATYALLAFLVERLTNGLATLLGYWRFWDTRFEPIGLTDPVRRDRVERNRRVALFVFSAVLAVIGAVLADLDLLAQLRDDRTITLAGKVVTGLLVASGADPIRELVSQHQHRREQPPKPSPLQVSGTLVVQQPGAGGDPESAHEG